MVQMTQKQAKPHNPISRTRWAFFSCQKKPIPIRNKLEKSNVMNRKFDVSSISPVITYWHEIIKIFIVIIKLYWTIIRKDLEKYQNHLVKSARSLFEIMVTSCTKTFKY